MAPLSSCARSGGAGSSAVRLGRRSAVRVARGGLYLMRRRAVSRSSPTECPAEKGRRLLVRVCTQENSAPGADV
ncbi:hypothetical protein NDU88_003607 [Pleurodeles waltl]|uniref:Uncharacterized protein n=1 Tax=Pleurodeles waltl TaxID=8319 RepID=A0AAV7M3V2_PLEWA|nr:hypothetical protein NDU88_003607 [Pleurodeles waltl]